MQIRVWYHIFALHTISSMTTHAFEDVARLAAPGDNVAIALDTLTAGTSIRHADQVLVLTNDVLEGHRFALQTITTGEHLLSWGLPFGAATKSIAPGDYVCNPLTLDILRDHLPEHPFPSEANFEDASYSYRFDKNAFQPANQVPFTDENRCFEGFARPGGRGTGTRNFIVVLGVTSRVAGLVRQLCSLFTGVTSEFTNVDGVVPVAHTEGGSRDATHNRELILRTLAGFVVHANVGAVLCLDYGDELISGEDLRKYLESNHYPLQHVPHAFLSVRGSIVETEIRANTIVSGWLDAVNRIERSAQPLAQLKLALQCGGSDAFSGISANPLVGRLSKSIVQHGGTACIAETTELIGAETYILNKVRDAETAKRFLDMIQNFRELAGRHGHDPEGNPSGGNRLRGLYNIIVKSIGAAFKKDPDLRLDRCMDYSERMLENGYVFMDTPGNDLESVAGQVAGGSNLILFTTGNGSITNFPFVPTIKFITTTERYKLLKNEMDVNAGVYLEGTPMDTLAQDTLDYMVEVASGKKTAGEKAGHSQVQLWRNWRQAEPADFDRVAMTEMFSETPITIRHMKHEPVSAVLEGAGSQGQKVGLICPNSLCAGQVAGLIARHLNQTVACESNFVSRFVSLPHTEGCGCSASNTEDDAVRTLRGYLTHPRVAVAVMLEHGCEKYRNRFIEQQLAAHDIATDQFGWASIQLDGGIQSVTQKVENWVRDRLATGPRPEERPLTGIGLYTLGTIPDNVSEAISVITQTCIARDGMIVVPASSSILNNKMFLDTLDVPDIPGACIPYGAHMGQPGFYVMDTPTHDDTDILSGLGATGVDAIIIVVPDHALQAHPFIPTIQVGMPGIMAEDDVDAVFAHEDSATIAAQICDLVAKAHCGWYSPCMQNRGCTDFQITRGRLGVSL